MKRFIITVFLALILSMQNNISLAENNDIYNQQWNTVLQLQRIIDNNITTEAPNLFSKRVRDKIKLMIEKDPSFFVKAWRLNDSNTKKYKEQVFSGKGLFILEDNEWKIDEI